jgi:aminocarboxymuconate-semialdehyde decarboxylase
MSTVIDVHTHMLNERWLRALESHAAPHYTVKEVKGGQRAVHLDGAPFMTLTPGMFDYDLRVKKMSEARVDVAIVSLTSPNVFWGGADVSTETARFMNDDMAQAQVAYPDRIRWFATLPWQFAEAAIAELDRATKAGAVGVMVLANIDGRNLTDDAFAPIWKEIDKRALPVLVHPTAPQGLAAMDMIAYNLVAATGFMFDTTLAVARMIFYGFFDCYPNLKLVAAHGGGTLPYIIGRLDQCYDHMPACRERITRKPSTYMPQIYLDAVVYQQDSLAQCIAVSGASNVLYGSDYPHNIGDMAGCLARVDMLRGRSRDKVRGQNAQAIFNL